MLLAFFSCKKDIVEPDMSIPELLLTQPFKEVSNWFLQILKGNGTEPKS